MSDAVLCVGMALAIVCILHEGWRWWRLSQDTEMCQRLGLDWDESSPEHLRALREWERQTRFPFLPWIGDD